jgi:hypothetical protein
MGFQFAQAAGVARLVQHLQRRTRQQRVPHQPFVRDHPVIFQPHDGLEHGAQAAGTQGGLEQARVVGVKAGGEHGRASVAAQDDRTASARDGPQLRPMRAPAMRGSLAAWTP